MLEPIATTDSTPRPRRAAQFVPPFRTGDKLDCHTFHRLYEDTPPGFKAELSGGIVCRPSPVSRDHAKPHSDSYSLLSHDEADTDGVETLIEITTLLSDESELQPGLPC